MERTRSFRECTATLLAVPLLWSGLAAFANHAYEDPRATDTSCQASVYDRPELFELFPESPDGAEPVKARARAPSNRWAPEYLLLQLYSKALRCSADSAFSASFHDLLGKVFRRGSGYAPEGSLVYSVGDRVAFDELIAGLLAGSETLKDATLRGSVADWIAHRCSDAHAPKKGCLRVASPPPAPFDWQAIRGLSGHAEGSALLRGVSDPARLFAKKVLGLTAGAHRRMDDELFKETPPLCDSGLAQLEAQLPADETKQIGVLFHLLGDFLRSCRTVRPDGLAGNNPSRGFGAALLALASRFCTPGDPLSPRQAGNAALARSICDNRAFFVSLLSNGAAARRVAAQVRAQSRALLYGGKVLGVTAEMEEVLDEVGDANDPRAARNGGRPDPTLQTLVPYLTESAHGPGGAPNSKNLLGGALAIPSGDAQWVARERVTRGQTADGKVLPSDRRLTRPGVPAEKFTGPRLGSHDAYGRPYDGWWKPRRFVHPIQDRPPLTYLNEGLLYVVAATAFPDEIDQTEISFGSLTAAQRLDLRRYLLELFTKIDRGDFSAVAGYFPDNTPVSRLPKESLLRAIANVLLWLDAPASSAAVPADAQRTAYLKWVRRDATAASQNKPWLPAGSEETWTDSLGKVFGPEKSGVPAPVRFALSQRDPKQLQALTELAAQGGQEPPLLRYAAPTLFGGGAPDEMKRLLGALEAELAPGSPHAPKTDSELRQKSALYWALRRGYTGAPPLAALPADRTVFRGCGRERRALTGEEIAIVNAMSTIKDDEFRTWLAASDPVALQSLLCQLDYNSAPPGFFQWRERAIELARRVRAHNLEVSKAYVRALQKPGAKFPPAALEARADAALDRWLELNDKKVRGRDEDAEMAQLELELETIAKARGTIVPEPPQWGRDWVELMRRNPRAFLERVRALPEPARQDLARELADLRNYQGTGWAVAKRDVEKVSDDTTGLLARDLERARALVNGTLAHDARPSGGFTRADLDQRRARLAQDRDAAVRAACLDGALPLTPRLFRARAALSDPRPQAARVEYYRQIQGNDEPDFGAQAGLLAQCFEGKHELGSDDLNKFLGKLGELPTHEIERMVAAFSLGRIGHISRAVAGLNNDDFALVKRTAERYLAARHAPAHFEQAALRAPENLDEMMKHIAPGQEQAFADYLYFLSFDLRALGPHGCQTQSADAFASARARPLVANHPQTGVTALADGLWQMTDAGIVATIAAMSPNSILAFLQHVELSRKLMAGRALDPEKDPFVERPSRLMAGYLTTFFESLFRQLREALRHADVAKLTELRDFFRKTNLLIIAQSLAEMNQHARFIPRAVADGMLQLMKFYEEEVDVMGMLLNKDRRVAFAYRGEAGQKWIFQPGPDDVIRQVKAEAWQKAVEQTQKDFWDAFDEYRKAGVRAADQDVFGEQYWQTLYQAESAAFYNRPFKPRNKNERALAINERSMRESIRDMVALGIPPEKLNELRSHVQKAFQENSELQDAKVRGFIVSSAMVVSTPLIFVGAPTVTLSARAAGSIALRLVLPPLVGAAIGASASLTAQLAKRWDDSRANRQVQPINWGAVWEEAKFGGAIGTAFAGVGFLPCGKVIEKYAARGLVVWGTAGAGTSAVLHLKDGEYAQASADTAFAALPIVAPRIVKCLAGPQTEPGALVVGEEPPTGPRPVVNCGGGVRGPAANCGPVVVPENANPKGMTGGVGRPGGPNMPAGPVLAAVDEVPGGAQPRPSGLGPAKQRPATLPGGTQAKQNHVEPGAPAPAGGEVPIRQAPPDAAAKLISEKNKAALVAKLQAEYPHLKPAEIEAIAEQQLEQVAAAWTHPFNFDSVFKEHTIAHAVHELLLAELAKDPTNAEGLRLWRAAYERYQKLLPEERPAFVAERAALLKELGVSSMEEYFRKVFNKPSDFIIHECWYKILKEYHDAPDAAARQAIVRKYDAPLLPEVYARAQSAAVPIERPLFRSVVPEVVEGSEPTAQVKAAVERSRETGGMVSTSLDPMEALEFRFQYWEKHGAPQAGPKQRVLTLIVYDASADNRGVVTTGGITGDGHSPATHGDYAKAEVLRTGGESTVKHVEQGTIGQLCPRILGDRPLPPKFAEQLRKFGDQPMFVVTVGKP